MSAPARFRFATAWLPRGWRNNVVIGVDAQGNIVEIRSDDTDTTATNIAGAAIAGLPNVHSHAFQRAMAGLAERRATGRDSFWTWRETMYDLAQRMTPEILNAVAAQLYVEMLKAGYTTVCEFHYLHHQAQGTPYADRTIMSQAVLDAASAAGIGMTLLPTLYQTSDFGAATPTPRQGQFVLETGAFIELCEALKARASSQVAIGVALHSLRAVPLASMREVLDASITRGGVVHIHVAEQEREVAACVAHTGQRPVEWLLQHVHVDERWCLVHATHSVESELIAIARSGASVALCPTTEANLGDGLFALSSFIDSGGSMAIGSDSHIAVAPAEELRWLEYQPRLLRRERNVLATADESTGSRLWRLACAGGARASGRRVGSLEEGNRADLVVLDLQSPALAGRSDAAIIDTFIFSSQPDMVRDVMVGGRWVVQDGHHFAEIPIAAGYRRAIERISE
jgi:formimidoylglutamate deiminase